MNVEQEAIPQSVLVVQWNIHHVESFDRALGLLQSLVGCRSVVISEVVAACHRLVIDEGPGAGAATQVRLGTGGCLRWTPIFRTRAA